MRGHIYFLMEKYWKLSLNYPCYSFLPPYISFYCLSDIVSDLQKIIFCIALCTKQNWKFASSICICFIMSTARRNIYIQVVFSCPDKNIWLLYFTTYILCSAVFSSYKIVFFPSKKKIPKILNPSYMMDLDIWDCFETEKKKTLYSRNLLDWFTLLGCFWRGGNHSLQAN